MNLSSAGAMRLCFCLLTIVLCFTAPRIFGAKQAPESEWPRHLIRFSPDVTLGDVFASGLRPYRFPGLEQTMLEAKHVIVQVAAEPNNFPEVACERVEINVNEPWILSIIILRTPPVTVERAKDETLKWLPHGTRTSEELDAFLAAVSADWLHYDDLPGSAKREFSFMWKLRDGQGPRVQVFLMKAYHPQTPLRFCVSFDTHHMRSGRTRRSFYSNPIPPPPGYENVSMVAPIDFGPDSPTSWMTPEEKGTVGVMMSDEWEKLHPAVQENALPRPPTPLRKQLSPVLSATRTSIWQRNALTRWVIVLVVIVAGLSLRWVLLKRRP